MMSDIEARLSVLRKWPDFQGYGFNLHGEKNKTGHFIGTVEEGSPAMSGGLMKADRLIEVNGINVTSRSHSDVVQLIRSAGDRVEMLVMTVEMEKEAISRGISVVSSGDNVVRIEAAGSQAEYMASQQPKPIEERSEEEQRKYEEEIADSVAAAAMAADSPAEHEEEVKAQKPEEPPVSYPAPVEPPAPAAAPEPAPTANGAAPPLTAAEFRAQLKMKKKNDPRQNPKSFRDKTLMFQQM